jgi:hypothetical protein
MKFNLHRGQMRLDVAGKPYYRAKSPKGVLMIENLKDGTKGLFYADSLGNIEVVAPKHIDTMVGLGYPIYDGDGKTYPVPMDDLLWISSRPDSPYWQKINEAKHLRSMKEES